MVSIATAFVLVLALAVAVKAKSVFLDCGAPKPVAGWRYDTGLYRSANARVAKSDHLITLARGWLDVYATHAYAPKGDLEYRIPVRAWRSYNVSLLFAETHVTAGQRRFKVSVNGRVVYAALDVAAVAGGRYRPLFLNVPRVYTKYGVIVVRLGRLPYANSPMISGIIVAGAGADAAVYAEGSALPALPRARSPPCKTAQRVFGRVSGAFKINTGGPFIPRLGVGADNLNYIIGDAGVAVGVDGSRVRVGNALRATFFKSQRFTRKRALTYRIPVAPGGRYTVRLFFAETYYNAPGRRVFNVRINGFVVAVNLDVFKEVGKNVELIRDFPNISSYHGSIIISFEKRIENPFINSIRISGTGANSTAIAGLESGLCVPVPVSPVLV